MALLLYIEDLPKRETQQQVERTKISMDVNSNTRGNANLLSEVKILSALNDQSFRKIYHLGVTVDETTPAWGGRTHAVSISQIPVGNNVTFNDDRVEAGVGIGTHVDGLGHVHHKGKYFGGLTNEQVFRKNGIKTLGIAENVPYFISRFKMLDMARYKNVPILNGGYEYTVSDIEGAMKLQNVSIDQGDIVMLRSGWIQHLNYPSAFNGSEPGPGMPAATYLANMEPVMIAGDTVALEVQTVDGWTDYPVHSLLLQQQGIYIGEIFNLEQLANDRVYDGTVIIPINQIAGLAQCQVNPICLAT